MNRLQIASVDDSPLDQAWLTAHLEAYCHQHHIPYVLSSFSCGEDFLAALNDSWFDIVFMDVYMTGISGVETAQLLRGRDRDCKLIFMTSSEDYMRQGFALNSAHYLVKPVGEEDFLQAMENCRIRRSCKVPLLSFSSGRKTIQIDTLDILFINMIDRIVTVHTKEGLVSAGRNFTSIAEPLLEDERFLLCNKGLLVNMDFISSQKDNDFYLTTGTKLPIAPRRKQELLSRYRNYIFGSMDGIE